VKTLIQIIPFIGIGGILIAIITYFSIRRLPSGNEKIQEVSARIRSGAVAFLRQEYSIIAIFVGVVFLCLWVFLNIQVGGTFLLGALCSASAGLFGMEAATQSSGRTLHAAMEKGEGEALLVAFRGGSVMGLTVASLGVVGLGFLYWVTRNPGVINGFALGASSIALFARVGGGIYTKAADVGADIVGKTELNLPEDDPRNPAVIADNVGDNVGDTAGMGADLFESYVGAVIATMAIGYSMYPSSKHMLLPLALIATGLVASVLGILSIRLFKKLDPASILRMSLYVSAGLFLIGAFFLVRGLMGNVKYFWSILIGIFIGIGIGGASEYFTSGPPVKKIAQSARAGPANTIIMGMAIGFESTVIPLFIIAMGILLAYQVGGFRGGLYSIALSAVSMLSTIGIVMATDSYGPIADNAGGIAEMSHAGPDVRKITDKLDALGNTTAAIGKGFAIGSAALTSLALFAAFQKLAGLRTIDLTNSRVVVGLFLGGMLACWIAALTLKAVGRTANQMVDEIRRQFKEIKGLAEGTVPPDSDAAIAIVTKGALREMVLPGMSAILAPIIVGFTLGLQALGGFLAGATLVGVVLGINMANTGAAWDNAKKWIEAGNEGGKGSDAHKAAVIGDTVGDPLKDTTGPSMNILIKLMAIVSLVLVPLFK